MLICQPIEINKMNKMKNKALVKSKKPRFINQGEMGGGGEPATQSNHTLQFSHQMKIPNICFNVLSHQTQQRNPLDKPQPNSKNTDV
jgi:hypothetical protein